MKKLFMMLVACVLLSLSLSLTVFAEESEEYSTQEKQIANIKLDFPNMWLYVDKQESEDNTIYSYTTLFENLFVISMPYDESMEDIADLFVGVVASGYKDNSGYSQIESNRTKIDLHTVQIDTFYADINDVYSVCMDVSVNTGTHIVDFVYTRDASTSAVGLDSFTHMIDTMDVLDNNEKATEDDGASYTKYDSGMYKVGADIPSGEYIVFAAEDRGYFCVSSDSNQDDILFNDNFVYNSIITINDGEYLDLTRCYAIPADENPNVDVTGAGMFKVGTHIPSGEYKLDSSDKMGYYCIYPDSRQDDIISNDNFEGQNYVTVSDGQYLVLSRCKFTEPPEKPVKTYSDSETIQKVQEALNAAGYECGTPDGIAGSGTKAAIEKYQADNSLAVTGTITDEVLESLGV